MTYTRRVISAQCKLSGPDIFPLPPGIDGAQLLWAISGNESSFGSDCTPRHEPAFDVGGIYGDNAVMKPLLEKFGSAAACSYGPWQIMFCNAPPGFTPDDLSRLPLVARVTVLFLNSLLDRFHPQDLAGIGECWNAGHTMAVPLPGVARYVNELVANYAVVMQVTS